VLSIEDVSETTLPSAQFPQAQAPWVLTPPYGNEDMDVDEDGKEDEKLRMDEDKTRLEDAAMDETHVEGEGMNMDDSTQDYFHLGYLADTEEDTDVAPTFLPLSAQVTQPTSGQISTPTAADFRTLVCRIRAASPDWSEAKRITETRSKRRRMGARFRLGSVKRWKIQFLAVALQCPWTAIDDTVCIPKSMSRLIIRTASGKPNGGHMLTVTYCLTQS
jgi:hypothetical protein